MCGIFALLNNSQEQTYPEEVVIRAFELGVNRGPEYSELKQMNENLVFGFHRLAINGLNKTSNQPMKIGDITLICNGEIYNFRELFKMIGIQPQTDSDCEIIIHLYKKFGIDYTLSLLDGYFSFILHDGSDTYETIYIVRDTYGVRPLYMLTSFHFSTHKTLCAFASELKVLSTLEQGKTNLGVYMISSKDTVIEQYQPGTYSKLTLNKATKQYVFDEYAKKFELFAFAPHYDLNDSNEITTAEYFGVFNRVHGALSQAVRKRVENTTDRPIACLLSGGLDSSLIAALVSKYYDKQLETYSIGMPGGEDLKYARMVSEHIGSKHTEIILSEDDFFSAIPEVIKAIESYDTTSVRASVGNYLVSKYIALNSQAKVVFNGDGSDELTGGYLYFHSAPNALEFDKEVKRLLSDIYLFDVLRSDKSISSHGLEPRTPFLDRSWVQTYLSVPLKFRYNPGKMEKWLLRSSIEAIDPGLLPREVLWRTKEAFSDGVSSQAKSWYEIITEKVASIGKGMDGEIYNYSHLPPQTLEQQYYRTIFESLYPNCSNVVPYFWMPRFVNASDASAITLNIYKKQL